MKKLMLMMLAVTFLAACSNEELPTGYTMSFKVGHVMQKTSHIVLDNGYAMVHEVELEKENEAFDVEVDIEGNYRFDLITGASNPVFPMAEVNPGLYHELEIKLGNENGDVSLYAEATYTDSAGTAYDLVLEVTHEVEFKLEDELNGISIDDQTISQLNVTLGLVQILESLDWSTYQMVNGVIRIDKDNNTTMYNAIVSALNTEIELNDD